MNAITDKFDEVGARLMAKDAEIERLKKTLGEIRRMKIMPDDKINRITLHAAIEIARMHLED